MKCIECKKKRKVQMDCSCGNKYCLDCLPYWIHKCSFDYKGKKKDALSKEIVEVKSAKVSDI